MCLVSRYGSVYVCFGGRSIDTGVVAECIACGVAYDHGTACEHAGYGTGI